MRPDEFLARLQQAQNSKELVDLLVQATALEPPMLVPFPPQKGTKLACTKNTPWVPAGTRAEPTWWCGRKKGYASATWDNSSEARHWELEPSDLEPTKPILKYKIKWANGREEEIDKATHDAYRFVYVY